MKPRAVTVVLFLLLVAALVYFNVFVVNGHITSTRFITKELYGWPFPFIDCERSLPNPTQVALSLSSPLNLFLNVLAWITLAALLPLTLHCLLNRTLHIHLVTAIALTFAAAVILYLNTQPMNKGHHGLDRVYGWPQSFYIIWADASDSRISLTRLLSNALVTLTLLCTVALLCEKLSTLIISKMKEHYIIIFRLVVLAVGYVAMYLTDPDNFRLYNFLSIFMLMYLPLHLIECLHKRTLHIHLATAVVLSILAAILLGLNLLYPSPDYGWPVVCFSAGKSDLSAFLGNLFLALTLLAAAALLSEKLLARRAPKSDPA